MKLALGMVQRGSRLLHDLLKGVLYLGLPQGTVALIHNGKMKLRLVVQ